jgi:hypothetical protein
MSIIKLINKKLNRILPAQHKSALYVLISGLLLLLLIPEPQHKLSGNGQPLSTNYIQQLVSSKFHELKASRAEHNTDFSSPDVLIIFGGSARR